MVGTWVARIALMYFANVVFGGPSMVVHGRVIDTEGHAVAGARVHLGIDIAPLHDSAKITDRWKPLTTVTGPDGEYAFTVVESGRSSAEHAFAVFAVHDALVSQRIVIDWSNEPVAVSDLVLATGIVGRVRVLWDDGSAASEVFLDVLLTEPMPEGADVRAAHQSFEGVTDKHGEISFGPIRDLVYRRIAVRASHLDAPTRFAWWDGQRVSQHTPIEVSLHRGRIVRGRLLTPDGQPAEGYCVAPWGGETGAPERRRLVTTDADGRFEVRGVGSPTGAIAVYERPRAPKTDDVHPRAAGYPLLIQAVPAGSDNLEAVFIPRLGTLTIRLEDTRGKPVRSGSGRWRRTKIRHGGTGVRIQQPGILRLKRVPLEIGITLFLGFDDSQHGELEQAFRIREVREETIVLRATGAGTVIFRLRRKGAPDKPLEVSYVSFGENEDHGEFRDGPLSELRWWTRPGVYQTLMVAAKGFREWRIENVTVRDDGPTFLDVELEPR